MSGARRGGSSLLLGGRMAPPLDRVCRGTKTPEPPEEAHPEHVEDTDPYPSPHGTNDTPKALLCASNHTGTAGGLGDSSVDLRRPIAVWLAGTAERLAQSQRLLIRRTAVERWTEATQSGQIVCVRACRSSIVARAAGGGTCQVSSMRTRPHQAQAGRVSHASNAVQIREKASVVSMVASTLPSVYAGIAGLLPAVASFVGGAGGRSRRWLSTTAPATSLSLRPLCWEWSRSISKARSALVEWRAISMPLACSISARRPNAPCRL